MKTVLVTGATGFIGCHLVRRLRANDAEVHALSRRRGAGEPGLAVHQADLLDPDATRAVVGAVKPDCVFHLAGRVDLERSAAVARACVDQNIVATLNLLEALRASAPRRLVYVSSTEVYGSGPVPFREAQPIDPPSPYAVSKAAAEQLCKIYGRIEGVEVCVLRLASAYGPGQPVARLIPSLVLAGLGGEPLRLRQPHHRRDFVYVEDMARGIALAGRARLGDFEVVNLGREDAVSLEEIARAVAVAAGRAGAEVVDLREPRPNESTYWATSAEKARVLLGWAPSVDLAAGLARTVEWYRARRAAGTHA